METTKDQKRQTERKQWRREMRENEKKERAYPYENRNEAEEKFRKLFIKTSCNLLNTRNQIRKMELMEQEGLSTDDFDQDAFLLKHTQELDQKEKETRDLVQ